MAVAVGLALCGLPLWYTVRFALHREGDGLRRMVDDPRFGETLLSTVALAGGSVAIAVVLGTSLAWAAHRLPVGRRALGLVPLFPLLLPQLPLVIGYAFLLSPTAGYLNQALRALPGLRHLHEGPIDVYTWPWIVIVGGIYLTAFVYLFVRDALGRIDPEVLEAAAVSGARPGRVLVEIVLPVLRPALLYGAATATLLGLGQFAAPLLYGRQAGVSVLTTEMYHRTSNAPADLPLAAAYGVPIVGVGVALLLVQWFALRDGLRFVAAPTRGGRAPSTGGRLATWSLALYGVVGAVLPLAALVLVAVSPVWTRDVDPGAWTLDHVRTVLFERSDVTGAVRNSLTYALATMVALLPLSYLLAALVHRRRTRLAGVVELVISLPLGVPAVIMGTGFLFAYTVSPLRIYGTPWALVLVYATIMLPFAVRLQLAARANLAPELGQAAAVSGAGPWRRALTIELPLLRPALGAAAALVVVLATHEFAASLLVRSSETQVMGTVLYDLWSFGSYPETAVMALVMFAVTGTGVALALLVGGRGTFAAPVVGARS